MRSPVRWSGTTPSDRWRRPPQGTVWGAISALLRHGALLAASSTDVGSSPDEVTSAAVVTVCGPGGTARQGPKHGSAYGPPDTAPLRLLYIMLIIGVTLRSREGLPKRCCCTYRRFGPLQRKHAGAHPSPQRSRSVAGSIGLMLCEMAPRVPDFDGFGMR
jgi:hypothetical protein